MRAGKLKYDNVRQPQIVETASIQPFYEAPVDGLGWNAKQRADQNIFPDKIR
jgi:hypothetical protein